MIVLHVVLASIVYITCTIVLLSITCAVLVLHVHVTLAIIISCTHLYM